LERQRKRIEISWPGIKIHSPSLKATAMRITFHHPPSGTVNALIFHDPSNPHHNTRKRTNNSSNYE
jgi:hypothetical protein